MKQLSYRTEHMVSSDTLKIFTIVVVYNGLQRNWVQKCFDSLIESSIPVDIIAIDNNSSDGSVRFIQNNYPNVDLITSKENLGFAEANNIGIKKAFNQHADYIFLINQDAWLAAKDSIEQLVKISAQNPEYGLVSPVHLNGTGVDLDANFKYYLRSTPHQNGLFDETAKSHLLFEIPFVNAAAWLLPRQTIERIGGFDSKLFRHYGEDDNYIQRLKYQNLKIGVFPNASICHDREWRDDNNLQFKRKIRLVAFKVALSDINVPLVQRSIIFLKLLKIVIKDGDMEKVKVSLILISFFCRILMRRKKIVVPL